MFLYDFEFYSHYDENPLKDLKKTVVSTGIYFRQVTLTALWKTDHQGQW